MPRVTLKTKSSRGGNATCGKCGKTIKAGEKFYEWSFFRQRPRRQHEACGRPRQSQLTNSKMSSVLAAIEDAEESIAKAEEPSDIGDALGSVASAAEEVASEYQEAAEAMGSAGEEGISGQRASSLEEFKDAVETAQSDIEGEEFSLDDESEADEAEQRKAWIEGLREQALDVLQELNVD